MVFEWCGHKVRLSAVYGHSDDSLLAIIDEKYMFSGDTLLHIPTITRFPTGSSRRFWLEDMPMLLVTKADKVFPGHGANGRLEDMMAVNKMPEKYKELNSK